MQDTLMTIIGVFLAVILIFIFPRMEIAGKTDELSETVVELAASQFVNNVASQGKITEFEYSSLIQKIGATGNTYEVEIEAKILDDNPSRITTTTSTSLIGEKKYYSVYTNTIINKLQTGADYYLKTDDYIIVTIKNKNLTIGSQLRGFMYQLMGQEASIVATTASALVLEHGEKPIVKIGDAPPIPTPVAPTPEPPPTPTPQIEPDPTPIPIANLEWKMDYYWLNDETDPWETNGNKITTHPGNNADNELQKKGVWDTSVSRINIPNRPTGTTTDIVEMIGNSIYPGRGAAWATLDGANLRELQFGYDIEQGDSFEDSGVIFNLSGVEDESEVLEGYYLSLIYRPIARLSGVHNKWGAVKEGKEDAIKWFNETIGSKYDGGNYIDILDKDDKNQYKVSGAIWKFTYVKGHINGKDAYNGLLMYKSSSKDASKLELIKTFDAGAEEYIPAGTKEKKIKFSGKISIRVADNGYIITVNGKTLQKIEVDSLKPNSFGFLSEHYRHGCNRIGYNKYENIRVITD